MIESLSIKDLDGHLINHDRAAEIVGLTRVGFDYWVNRKHAGPLSLVVGNARLYLLHEVLAWKRERLDRLPARSKKRRKGRPERTWPA